MSSLDLGVIGNCQIAVLVDKVGRYVWGCFPRYDSDPVFCSLLNSDDGGDRFGFFDIELQDFARSEQAYVENTAILSTTLIDGTGGAVRIIDYAPRYSQYGRSFHPIMVIRQVVPVGGAPAIRIRLRPATDYGSRRPAVTHGSNHIRFESGDYRMRLTTNAQLSAILEERVVMLQKPITLILGPDETISESPDKINREMCGETQSYWQGWTRALSIPFEWQREVIRAAITLKLCTYEDTGAVLAALTTSIPEAPDSGRNWDYRYCWLRDSYYTVQALNRLGATKTMEEFLRYIFNIVAAHGKGDMLQPVYGISGEADLSERSVPGLEGYRGMGPARVGNDAYLQVQNDSYGAAIMAATQSFFDSRLVDRRGRREFEWLESLGRRAAELYDKPDAGLWEYRGRSRVHTYSSVMCWAACDRLARIASRLGLTDRAAFWTREAAGIQRTVLEKAWSEKRKSLVASFDDEQLDASLLTLADLGFIEAQDPRFLATVAAIEKELKHGPYLFRYMSEDDFGAPVTAFNICTFWYINALAAIGRREEARELFENMLARRTTQGLLSEDLSPATGELWGNFPQTYSMVGIISAAMRLSKTWEQAL
ncbi:MAG TPA: glycoside hydrolase family 15 protein [Gammaproteobacteria bacterium]|nr:glycoside hydrolase family 15 protein [Gammaproteobacteria bacterium]